MKIQIKGTVWFCMFLHSSSQPLPKTPPKNTFSSFNYYIELYQCWGFFFPNTELTSVLEFKKFKEELIY